MARSGMNIRLQRLCLRENQALQRILIVQHRGTVARTDQIVLSRRNEDGAREVRRADRFERVGVGSWGGGAGDGGDFGEGAGLVDGVCVLERGEVEGRVEEGVRVRDFVCEAEVAVVWPLECWVDSVRQAAGEGGEDEVLQEWGDGRVAGVGDAREEGGVDEVRGGA